MEVVEKVEKVEKPNVYLHLIPNDLAESLLNKAETLSIKGRINGSIRAFRQAAKLFGDIERFLDVREWEVEDQAEREPIDKMRYLARLKRKYCLTRIGMEEAKKSKMQCDNA